MSGRRKYISEYYRSYIDGKRSITKMIDFSGFPYAITGYIRSVLRYESEFCAVSCTLTSWNS